MAEVKKLSFLISAKSTEKAINLIQKNNTLTFIVDPKANKIQIKKEVEEVFNVKVEKVNIINHANRKIALVKLKKDFSASTIATKLGIM
jgi:large subunit ribosomal protein L23